MYQTKCKAFEMISFKPHTQPDFTVEEKLKEVK